MLQSLFPSSWNRYFGRPLQFLLVIPLLVTLIYLYWTIAPDEFELERPFDTTPLQELIADVNSSSFSCFGSEGKWIYRSLEKAEDVYQSYIKKRRARVQQHPERINPLKPHTYSYDYFLATFTCPFSTERIGTLGDGGKWVCGMEVLEQKSSCIVYSFGIASETSFEVEILERTRCEIYGYDASVNEAAGIPQEHQKRVHFFKKYGGNQDSSNYVTLGGAMKRNGHNKIDLLKIDIEGSEFAMLKQAIDEFGDNLPFTQLLVEIHANVDAREGSGGFVKLYGFFDMLERAGLRPFRNELNISPQVQGSSFTSALSEYSFINVKQLC